MKTVSLVAAVIAGAIVSIAILHPLAAQSQGASLETRVAVLEATVSQLNQRVANLERVCNIRWDKDIKRTYTGIGETWQIKILSRTGGELVLANRTRWLPNPRDVQWIAKWDPLDIVEIGTSKNPDYPYTFNNMKKQQVIEVKYLGMP